MKNFCFPMFYNQSKFLKKRRNNVVTTKIFELKTIKNLSCTIKSPSFTKKRIETGIFLDFLVIFQKYKKGKKGIRSKEWEKDNVASFPLTTILYGSAYWKYSE